MSSPFNGGVANYNVWRAHSESRAAFAAILTVGSFTAISRFIGMCKDMLVAHHFGSAGDLDAFYIALMVPTGFINVTGAAIGNAFIPIYLRVKQRHGSGAAQKVFESAGLLNVLMLTAALIVTLALSRPLISVVAPGFGSSQVAFTSQLLIVMSVMLVANGVMMMWSSVLNAEGYFATVAMSASVTPSVLIVALLLAPNKWGVYVLAGATVAGAVTECIIVGWEMRRRGFSVVPMWNGRDGYLSSILSQVVPNLAGGLWSSAAAIVDQSMASVLPTGSVASLNYGGRVVNAVLSLIGNPLAVAVLPGFSRLVAVEDWVGVRRLLRHYLLVAFVAGIVPALLVLLFSRSLTTLLYERGAFNASDATTVAHIQSAFAVQIPVYLLGTVTVRLLAALGRNWVRTAGGCVNVVLNIGFNYWFMRSYGVVGIASSTSLVCCVSFIFLMVVVKRALEVAALGSCPVKEPVI